MPKDRRWGRWSRRPRDPFADPEPDPDAPTQTISSAAAPVTRMTPPVSDAPFPAGARTPGDAAFSGAADDPFGPGDGAFAPTPFDAVPDPGPAPAVAAPPAAASQPPSHSPSPSPSPFDAPGIADPGPAAGAGFTDLGPLGGDPSPSVPPTAPAAPSPLDIQGNGTSGGTPPDASGERSELAQARYDRMVAAAGLEPTHDLSPHGLSVLDWLAKQDDAICSGVVEVLQATGQATIRHLRSTQA